MFNLTNQSLRLIIDQHIKFVPLSLLPHGLEPDLRIIGPRHGQTLSVGCEGQKLNVVVVNMIAHLGRKTFFEAFLLASGSIAVVALEGSKTELA